MIWIGTQGDFLAVLSNSTVHLSGDDMCVL